MPAGPASVFHDGLALGELRFPFCRECQSAFFYPRVLCPTCGSTDLEWRQSRGEGVVYAQTWIHARDGGYSVVLVDLDEGFRVMSSVVDAVPADIRTGGRVAMAFDRVDDAPRFVFTMMGEGA